MNSITAHGQFTVCITERPIRETALELSTELTADGTPLLILDAAGCFEPTAMSQAGPDLARYAHILRVPSSADFEAVWSSLLWAQQRFQARRALVVGLLNHLYDPQIQTRDAARALGRIKTKLEALTQHGLEVMVVCESGSPSGTRAHFIPSLCASAHQVVEYRQPAVSVS